MPWLIASNRRDKCFKIKDKSIGKHWESSRVQTTRKSKKQKKQRDESTIQHTQVYSVVAHRWHTQAAFVTHRAVDKLRARRNVECQKQSCPRTHRYWDHADNKKQVNHRLSPNINSTIVPPLWNVADFKSHA